MTSVVRMAARFAALPGVAKAWLASARRAARVAPWFDREDAMADTVKLEIEFGDIEVAFEGPAAFARSDLVPLVSTLIEKLASVEIGFDADEDDAHEDDADEDEDGGDGAAEADEARPAGR
jgi:hypothetical protein